MTTLTYVYADQTAVVGPLSTYAEPHAYDLCAQHSERLSAPRGWEVLRLAGDYTSRGPTTDDLLALADAVRETGRPLNDQPPLGRASSRPPETRHTDGNGRDREAPQLSGPQLSGPQLSGPKLSGPKLSGSKLSGPKLSGRRGHLRVLTADDAGE